MKLRKILGRVVPAIAVILYVMQPAFANAATGYTRSAYLTMSDSRPSTTAVGYTMTSIVSPTNAATGIACIRLKIDTNTTATGGAPAGFDSTGASFDSGSSDFLASWTGWSADVSVNGTMDLTKSSGTSTPNSSSRSVAFTGITNGNTSGTTYWVHWRTFSDNSCSTLVDTAIAALIYVDGQTVTTQVDPSLSFSVAGKNSGTSCNGATTNITTTNTTIPLGTVTITTNKTGAQDLTVGSNGTGVYVYTWATDQLRRIQDGTSTISDASGTNAAPASFAAPGSESWGYTSSATDTTGKNLANDRFSSDLWSRFITTANTDHVFFANGIPVDATTGSGSGGVYAGGQFCVGYQVGISSITEAGNYTTTVIYNVVPTY